MNNVDRYLQAAVRENTRRSYRAAVEHFEVTWGGFLPATAESIARYLADYAGEHSINTLKQRLAALGQWHASQGFADPTKAPLVRQMIKGIRSLHPTQPKQAAPCCCNTCKVRSRTWSARPRTRNTARICPDCYALAATAHCCYSASGKVFEGTNWHVCASNTFRRKQVPACRSTCRKAKPTAWPWVFTIRRRH